ncbi:hypothetical protein PENSPDRAFT_690472 [Peniophora sp. CONT]|nr:hypothetical protein PENSPDRAFT_690472 [Peniophora sp. CONT]
MPAVVSAPEVNVNDDRTAQCNPSPLDASAPTISATHPLSTSPATVRTNTMPTLPRALSRSRPSLASSSSLDSIAEDVPLCLTARSASQTPSSPSSPTRTTSSRTRRKSTALKEACGICFESTAMRNPDVARCCLQMFCHEHLADWLKRDSRCPGCGSPLSLERGTVALRAPTRTTKPPALEPGRLTARQRTSATFLIASTTSANSTSSSSSDGEEGEERRMFGRRRQCQTPLPIVGRPQYSSLHELAAALLPLQTVGVLLSLTGCALMVSVVLA